MILSRSNIRKKTSYNYSSGFALPTILIASMIMLSVLLVSVASTAAIRVSLLSQTYNQMAQTSGDAGVVYAKACLDANSGVPLWSDAKPLGPNTDCSGNQLAGFTCPASSVDSRCYITVNSNAPTAQVLVVGGGGGGGYARTGGGGAGGLVASPVNITPQVYTIVIGGGGGGGSSASELGTNGFNSSAFGITAIGGGGGAGYNLSNNGNNGGSGGGGGGWASGVKNGGIGTSGQGNNGGVGVGAGVGGWTAGGGGGGAGGAGANATGTGAASTNNLPGIGGAGIASSISGSPVTYAGGGGGAGIASAGAESAAAGGSGGGGIGNGASGTANTGSGGGAGAAPASGTGGAGGSGIVIISYPTASITATVTGSVTTSTSGSNTIQKFTGNGTFTVTSAGNGAVTSTFSVGLPTLVNGKAGEVNSVGTTKLLRSSTGTAWRTYSQSSRLTIPPVSAKVLVVAGGGSGGGSSGTSIGSGGGGAGGLVYSDSYNITASSYTVTVGSGGIGVSGFKAGSNGQNSSFIPTGSSNYGSSSTAGKSCYSLKLDGINTDGVYWIDPDGAGSNTPFQVYCDMTNNGGGWTMMMKSTRGTTFNYYSSYWTTSNTLNTAETNTNDGDAKFRSFNEYPVRDLMARWPDVNSGTWRWLQKDFNDATPITLPTFFSTANLKFFGDAKNFSGWSNGIFSSQVDIRFYGFNFVNNKSNGLNANVRWGFGWNENSEGLYTDPSTLSLGGAPGSDDVSGGIGMDSNFGNYSAGDVINCCNDTTGINRSARVEVYGRNTNDQPDSTSSISAVGGGYGGTWTITPTLGGSGGGAGENGQSLDGATGTSGQGNAGGNDNGYDSGTPSAGGGGGGAGAAGGNSTTDTIGGNGGLGIANSISGNSIYYAGGGGGSGSTTMGTGGNGGGGNGKGVTTGTGVAGTANTGGGGGGSLTNAAEAAQPGGAGGSGVVVISYPTGSMTATGGTITTSGGNTIHTFTSSGTFTIGSGGGGGGSSTYGGGGDGAITVAANKNINTDTLATGRTCADAVNYSVTTLSTNTATLSTTPAAGCLVAGDEILLINLQGISSNYANVGNFETLKIQSISTNTITFTSNKTNFYGNGASDDTNLGTATTNQRVMLQRVPNYTSVTVNSGITLTTNAWDGAKSGVLFFRANGTVTINGPIIASQLGQTQGNGGAGSGYYVGQNATLSGNGYGPSSNAGTNFGGNGASLCTPETCGIISGGAGGGGGGYASSGTSGGNATGGNGGAGGLSYGVANLTKLYLGSGGGGGSGGTAGSCGGGNGGAGGLGGGIISIFASSVNISGTGAITSNGQIGLNGGNSCNSNDGSGAGGGGGSGGSINIIANIISNTGTVNAIGGVAGSGSTYGRSGANGGAGSVGRIAISATSISGTTTPTYTAF